jgi:hypothetical protein
VLPAWLTVEALKQRIDKQLSSDDALLAELLEGAFDQAQAPPPYGTGRLLVPDPAPEGKPEEDSSTPVSREIEVRGRRVLIPDARAVTAVTVEGEPLEPGGTTPEVEGVEVGEPAGYRLVWKDGAIVRIDLTRESWNRWWSDQFGYLYGPQMHERPIEVTGRFGFVTPPVNVIGAIYTLAARRYYERLAQYADAVAVGDGATAQTYYRQLPPEVRVAFESFSLPAGIGGLA